jgi:DNA-binding ferritin-like protein
MNKTRNSLPPQVRKEAITALNQTVIELFDLFACIKQARWNAGRTIFIKLDELASNLMGHIDHAAERATSLGGIADGAFREGVKLPHFKRKKELPSSVNGFSDWIQELADLYGNAGQHVREAIKQLVDVHDFGSAYLLADILRTLDLHLWMLETHLSQQQLKTRTSQCFTHSLSS